MSEEEGYIISENGVERPMNTAEIEEFKKMRERIEADDLENAILNSRLERDARLKDTDWIVLRKTERDVDIPSEWITYRQALRDLPTHANWPKLRIDDWPTKPE